MLPSVDSLLACRFIPEPPRGNSTAIPVSTLRWMLLPPPLPPPDFPPFLPVDASEGGTQIQALLIGCNWLEGTRTRSPDQDLVLVDQDGTPSSQPQL